MAKAKAKEGKVKQSKIKALSGALKDYRYGCVEKAKAKKYPLHCNQCDYDWQSKKRHPLHCAHCISDKWDKPLVGKKLRKAVPSRVRARKGHKVAAPKKGRVKRVKPREISDSTTYGEPPVKASRAPRVKKEKTAPALAEE